MIAVFFAKNLILIVKKKQQLGSLKLNVIFTTQLEVWKNSKTLKTSSIKS
jgi:hypothetical protein